METMHGNNAWRQCMETMHGDNAWKQCMEIMHRDNAWKQCMEIMHGDNAWRQCMETMHGDNAWKQCMETMHGNNAWRQCMKTCGTSWRPNLKTPPPKFLLTMPMHEAVCKVPLYKSFTFTHVLRDQPLQLTGACVIIQSLFFLLLSFSDGDVFKFE